MREVADVGFRLRLATIPALVWNDFRVATYVYTVLFAGSVAVLAASEVMPVAKVELAGSGTTPWGVVTSLFVHGDSWHLLANMIGLLTSILILATTNLHQTATIRRGRARLFAWNILFSAVAANVVWTTLAPEAKIIGSSGATFASMGIVMGFALCNIVPGQGRLNDIIRLWRDRTQRARVRTNLAVVFLFVIVVAFARDQFLGVEPGVNFFGHAIGFSLGLLSAYVYWITRERRMLDTRL